MYETSNDLAPTTRRSVVEMLNEHLADAIDLQLQGILPEGRRVYARA